ncbi:MAG TPA: hypothetical protein VH502_07660, partial [Actinoplanes sp.]
MRSRGADRPDDEAGRDEQPGRSRRLFGRARPEPPVPEEVPQEETGWLDDLRTAKAERTSIGPGVTSGEVRTGKSRRVAPGPPDEPAPWSAPPASVSPPSAPARPMSPPSTGTGPVSPPSGGPRP